MLSRVMPSYLSMTPLAGVTTSSYHDPTRGTKLPVAKTRAKGSSKKSLI